MHAQRATVKAATLPLPVRAAPIALLGVMAVAVPAAMVASQVIALMSGL